MNATEVLAGSGYPWLLLDMEHTTLGVAQVADHFRAARGGTAEIVVRVPWNEPVLVKRLLDAGIRSFMFPFVQSGAEARPCGRRHPLPAARDPRLQRHSRANLFSRVKDYALSAHESVCVVVQVETPTAVAAIPEIGAVEGVDGIFIGPNDLAANMGFLARSGAPEVRAAVRGALGAIQATGKAPGMLEFDVPQARALFEAGFTFVAVGSDVSILGKESEVLLEQIGTGRAGA